MDRQHPQGFIRSHNDPNFGVLPQLRDNLYDARRKHPAFLGLTRTELDAYSLSELIMAAAMVDSNKLRRYREITDAIHAKTGEAPTTISSFFIPHEFATRDLTAASASGGGYLADTQVSFGTGLWGSNLIGRLPIRIEPLRGNLSSAEVASVSTQWLQTEATEASHASPQFTAAAATPKTVCSFSLGSNTFQAQAGVEGLRFVERAMGAQLAQDVSKALINGSGTSGQPQGLLNTPSTVDVPGTTLGWSGVRDMIAAAEGYTVDGLVFVAGITAAKTLRNRELASGSGMVFADGKIDGIPVYVSRCAPDDSLVLAPWPLVAMCTWGAIELTVTPFASPTAFKNGQIGIRLIWSVDFYADHPSAIAKSTSIT